LKNLVAKKGVTICSVIHQPRKTIFELFDSMILLGFGGRMVYHGRVDEAEEYFDELGYHLPLGESVADWFIDISTGRLDAEKKHLRRTSRKYSIVQRRDTSVVEMKSGDEKGGANKANLNCLKLYRNWIKHFEGLDQEERKQYEAPKPFDFPASTVKQHFFKQVLNHLRRNFIVTKRNIATTILDTIIMTVVVIVLSLMSGVLKITGDKTPNLRNEYELLTSFDPIVLSNLVKTEDDAIDLIKGLFGYSIKGQANIMGYTVKMSLVLSLLLAISASKILLGKRLEFFREAGSGYNLTAYYLAANLWSTLEVTIQIILVATPAIWLRQNVGSYFCLLLSFIMMAWVSTSWSFVFPLFVPRQNVALVIALFTILFSILFGGFMSPGTWKAIYNTKVITFISGMFSSSRHLAETMLVSQLRTLPQQSGWTLQKPFPDSIIDQFENINFDYKKYKNLFAVQSLAQTNMPDASIQSHFGWYHQILPPFLVGLTVRLGGALLIHTCNRSQQAKTSIISELKRNVPYRIEIFVILCCLVSFFVLSLWAIGIF